MSPRHLAMQTPERGFQWLPGEEFRGRCDAVPAEGWLRRPSKTLDLFIHTEGPAGSGRYWTITVGVAPRRQKKPARGFCFQTSTVGWRTLQPFSPSPLPWTGDQDRDGTPELLLWDSFPPAGASSSLAEFGLIAWIYEFDAKGRFAIDWRKSRDHAAQLAASYRTPAPAQGALQTLRNAAAQALSAFATGACSAEGMPVQRQHGR